MDSERREALKNTRTIFLSDKQPHYENLSTLPELWWVSVKLTTEDRLLADEELMDVVAERCHAGDCEVTHHDALHHQQSLYISFPVMNPDKDLAQQGWIVMVIGLAEHYRMEIAAGRLSIDRSYVFGPRD
ncbi:hypothetical protein LT330_006037 [Penicillium expansum]|uniref:Uncharacterized protein n=1 Tax=Penicillium expansum TaxID=27334 RepID=A0A0A2INW8_PENEN|nr:hypothetical protein PEX2_073600 [Penicillium expansum]KAK4869655.1 hypothetical protein LT330_006037 [Penicillium expansum]KGO36083.1 hypothetical protein PEXP_076020 [Penicillium expansum]KGO41955.1 hypothetical protein PEX1_012500 [Penicillium expansum]KGO59405.1 hypothetical protein PEX2_073600 [Penicillium expansum]